ncbi:MAG: CDP-diacylglycerol--serine O-phosphatidyltransferase [Syntrophales bacterium]|nr:CDP-diacylglycerol--serine O-phosphatidyltransferase [Syntrophales bacterium]MDY0043786.1 CDP-diacylglycerol--serine O-phosphatidyltransferase [Syntrophales bacterium]
MKKGIYLLPNLFTTGSLFCGFYAIISAVGDNFHRAAVLIIIACILDGLDGKIARFTNTTSSFGVEYDSLSDLVSFGVAPAILSFKWTLEPYGRYGWLAAFLFVACGALRLARFNVQSSGTSNKLFRGLPIPAAALVIATTILLYMYTGGTGTLYHPLAPGVLLLLSLLMVSNIHYYSFKDLNFFSQKPFMTLVLIVLLFVIIVLEPQIMLFAVALGYSLSGPSWALWKAVNKKIHRGQEDEEYQ